MQLVQVAGLSEKKILKELKKNMLLAG